VISPDLLSGFLLCGAPIIAWQVGRRLWRYYWSMRSPVEEHLRRRAIEQADEYFNQLEGPEVGLRIYRNENEDYEA
jgi:hypothetical protein